MSPENRDYRTFQNTCSNQPVPSIGYRILYQVHALTLVVMIYRDGQWPCHDRTLVSIYPLCSPKICSFDALHSMIMEYGRSYNQQNDYNQTHILMGIASENDELYQSKEKRLRMSTSVIEIHIPTAYVARKGSF